MDNSKSIIYKPETHRILYILLLIATPFLLLQNYLQSLIGELSNLTYSIGNFEIPVTVLVTLIIIIVILLTTYKKLNRIRITSWIIVIFLFWIGQKSTDYYFNHSYYELQYNWHYFAYAIFAYINFRALTEKKAPAQKVILITFLTALAVSTMDEILQMPLSNRIFDIGDISKDLWGAMIGLFIIYFILENGSIVKTGWKVQQPKIKDYIQSPFAILIILFVFSYIFMVVASLLTETKYIFQTVLITVLIFLVFITILHLSQRKVPKTIILIVAAILIVTQGYFFVIHFNDNITYNKNNIIVYKGIPIVYFDVMIYPNGLFRLVDKKKIFNKRDQHTIFSLSEHIIVFGTGIDDSGGVGFPLVQETQFVFNTDKQKGIQIILQENDAACQTYNRIVSEGKKPLLIFHNN